ncbi:YhfG family protein [Glaciimonas sp. GNP009]
MLTKELKLQVFQSLRSENYRASLRLEGLEPKPLTKLITKPKATAKKTKHD